MKRGFTFFTAVLATIAMFTACGTATHVPTETEDDYDTGYGTISRDKNTNAISQVKFGDEATSYTSIQEYLVGRVAGLDMTSDGRLNIRGVQIYTGEIIEPMLIVDGTEVRSIDYLNPSDVYSVNVLKDASASMYGSRSAGGVILITTKGAQYVKEGSKAKDKKKTTVTVETSTTVGTPIEKKK